MSAFAEITNSPRATKQPHKPPMMILVSPPCFTSSSSSSSSPAPLLPKSPPVAPPPTHDAYGFPNSPNHHVTNGTTTTQECADAWESYSTSDLSDFRTDTLQDIIIQHGIPTSRRADLWFQWSGAEDKKMAANEDNQTYLKYSNTTISKKVNQQIALDLPRTCPKHPAFSCDNPDEDDESKQIVGPGRSAIGRVLRAYAARNPELGYLQSMNFLAAMLYLVLDGDENRMFWMLTTIVEDILAGYFTAKLAKLLENVDAFSIVLNQVYPDIAKQLEKHGLNISFRAPTWFLCMYFTSLKSEVVTRVWDMIFYNVKRCPEGTCGPAALCCVGLGIVDTVSNQILTATNIAECAKALQNASHHVLDAKQLICKSFEEINTISDMVQRLASKSVRGALKKQRDQIANRRKHRPSMTARKPKRKRHVRSLSDGSIPLNFSIQDMEQQPGPQHSPGTNARIVASNKRRRVALQRHNGVNGAVDSAMDATASGAMPAAAPSFSPFAAIKKWLTPKKAATPGNIAHRRRARAPPATTHVRRINFGGAPSSSKNHSSRRQHQRKPSVVLHLPLHMQNGATPRGQDSPRGDFELKFKTTPAKIRARAEAANGYGTPPGAAASPRHTMF